MRFELAVDYRPRGDQETAIAQLVQGLREGEQHQTLLGVTGSGKTFTMAKVIEAMGKPSLVLAHNKLLAAQLFHEFKTFFPHNAVEYFVSYYDYYQPEAYIPSGDVYIEKEATINDELDKLRLSATRSLFERRDCVIIASVSCIYGLGSPEAYYGMLLMLEKGQKVARKDLLSRLVEILYERNDGDFRRGTFRVRGDVVEVFPTYDDNAYRIEFWGDEIESLSQIDPLLGQVRQTYVRLPIYPKTHYVLSPEMKQNAMVSIENELRWWHAELVAQNKLIEAQRLWQRTAGLPAERRAYLHRRESPDDAAVAGHVSRGPLTKGRAGELRFPASERARQSAADLRGVRAPCESGHLRVGHSGPVRTHEIVRCGGGTDHPSNRPDGP
jgi:excinuclease ABC subunit B